MSVPLPAPDGPVTTNTGRGGSCAYPRWLKSSTSSARWRSERPPTVFDWLIRHWLRSRAAFTRPNFGTAMSMSKTFAVSTHSGGSSKIVSMLSRPALRSRLSCARRTRTSFARWSASILWSSERAGACACDFVVTMSRTSLPMFPGRSSRTVLRDLQVFCCCPRRLHDRRLCRSVSNRLPLCHRTGAFVVELGANPRRRPGIDEEHCPERDGARPGGHEIVCITRREDPTHAHDREIDGLRACVDAGEGDGSQPRAGVAAGAPREFRTMRLRVDCEPTDGVDQRQAVGPGVCHGARRL